MLLGVATETLQIFVPGRGPGVTDVALDWSGLLAAALLLFFFGVSQRVGLLLKK
jgi:VanZ family protein